MLDRRARSYFLTVLLSDGKSRAGWHRPVDTDRARGEHFRLGSAAIAFIGASPAGLLVSVAA
jgi:hypothetical protein